MSGGHADLVVHGSVYSGDAVRGWARGRRRCGATASWPSAPRSRPASWSAPRPGWSTRATARDPPGFQDAHIHAPFAGRNRLHLSPQRPIGRDDYLARDQRVRRGPPRRGRGSWAAAGRWSTSPAAPRQGRPRRDRPRPARVPVQQGHPRRLGQQPGARARRHRRRARPIRPTAATSATPTACSPACCTRARRTPSRTASCRARTRTSGPPRSSTRRPTCTRWGSPGGRTRG